MTKDQYLKQMLAIRPSLMKAWIWSVTRDFPHLEELREEVISRLLNVNDATLRPMMSVKTHVRDVCKCVGMKWIDAGSVRRCSRSVESIIPSDDLAQDSQLTQSEEQRLEAAIAALTPRQRSILLLREKHGFTTNEIAVQLGIKEATVKKHLSEARRFRADFLRPKLTDAWLSAEALWKQFECWVAGREQAAALHQIDRGWNDTDD